MRTIRSAAKTPRGLTAATNDGGPRGKVVPLRPVPGGRALTLTDGATATVVDDALELRDAAGRLLVRYSEGAAEIVAADRDLKLSAPRGRVVLDAALDVELHAARDVTQSAGRRMTLDAAEGTQTLELSGQRTSLSASKLDVEAEESRLVTGKAAVVARSISTHAEKLVQQVERYELRATTIVEQARDSLREISGLAQSRLGRAKLLVSQTFSLRSRRAVMVSKEETTIDGERVLLG